MLEKSGGAEAFARKVANFIDTRCKTQLAAWVGGILVFFSELGTPMIVGPIFAPIFKKMRISKEKLAWILDSTANQSNSKISAWNLFYRESLRNQNTK